MTICMHEAAQRNSSSREAHWSYLACEQRMPLHAQPNMTLNINKGTRWHWRVYAVIYGGAAAAPAH